MSVGDKQVVSAICLVILLAQKAESRDVSFYCYQTQQQKIAALIVHAQLSTAIFNLMCLN